jgi:hypothetical protein
MSLSHLFTHRKTRRALWLLATCLGLGLALWLPLPQPSATVYAQNGTVPPPGQLYLPTLHYSSPPPAPVPACPTTSTNQDSAIAIEANPRDPNPPPHLAPDINLAVRGFVSADAHLGLIEIGGPTDDDAPQLAYLFRSPRIPDFPAAFRVYDWNWNCQPGGCRGSLIEEYDVTLLAMATAPREPIYIPRRNADIYVGSYYALVLYAEEKRITFTYTRRDTPAIGYLIHIEEVCVDPNLLALYRRLDQEGRRRLPGLRLDSVVGVAEDRRILIAVRDTGSFMDPRTAKDWWQDVVRARRAGLTFP